MNILLVEIEYIFLIHKLHPIPYCGAVKLLKEKFSNICSCNYQSNDKFASWINIPPLSYAYMYIYKSNNKYSSRINVASLSIWILNVFNFVGLCFPWIYNSKLCYVLCYIFCIISFLNHIIIIDIICPINLYGDNYSTYDFKRINAWKLLMIHYIT